MVPVAGCDMSSCIIVILLSASQAIVVQFVVCKKHLFLEDNGRLEAKAEGDPVQAEVHTSHKLKQGGAWTPLDST